MLQPVREARANYYGKISLIDAWVGRVVGAFEFQPHDAFPVFGKGAVLVFAEDVVAHPFEQLGLGAR